MIMAARAQRELRLLFRRDEACCARALDNDVRFSSVDDDNHKTRLVAVLIFQLQSLHHELAIMIKDWS